MEEKNLNERESLELIARMIGRTRRKLDLGAGNVFIFWGVLVVAVVALAYLLPVVAGYHSWMSWMYMLIPAVGLPVTFYWQSKKRGDAEMVTYTDRISGELWKLVMWIAVGSVVLSFVFLLSGLNVWYIMFVFGFLVVGMATAVQGIIIRERSLMLGGMFGVLAGGFLCVGIIAGATRILMAFVSPMLALTYILMFIVPGCILNAKAKRGCYEGA